MHKCMSITVLINELLATEPRRRALWECRLKMVKHWEIKMLNFRAVKTDV